MKFNKLCLFLLFCLLVFCGCKNGSDKIGDLQGMSFGKNLTITISESEIIDAGYLQQVLDGNMERDTPFFDLWDTQEFIKMIDYMDENNLMLVAGKYTFNQAWKFDNGFLVSNNNEKHEIFKFKQKT